MRFFSFSGFTLRIISGGWCIGPQTAHDENGTVSQLVAGFAVLVKVPAGNCANGKKISLPSGLMHF